MAQNLKAQLAKANTTMELDIVEQATYVPRWLAADFATTLANNGGRIDPDTMYTRYFTSTGNLNKVAGYSSETMDALFAAGKSEGNPSARKQIYADIAAELENNAVWVWMFTGLTYTAVSDSVTGFVPMTTGSWQYLRTTGLK